MTPTPEQVADLLDDAAALTERDGWAQGWMHDPDGRWCQVGAIKGAAAARGMQWNWPLLQAAFNAVADAIGVPTVELTGWNDAEGRTEQQVLGMLRTTAKRQRVAADQAGATP
jgi:hypothetical protein